MCLTVRKKKGWYPFRRDFRKPLVAKKDIICYKVYNILPDGRLQSIYQKAVYEPDEPLPQVEFGIEDYSDSIYGPRIEIEEGYHSYIQSIEPARGTLFQCMIPEGSLYFLGNFDGINNSYASNNLVILCRV